MYQIYCQRCLIKMLRNNDRPGVLLMKNDPFSCHISKRSSFLFLLDYAQDDVLCRIHQDLRKCWFIWSSSLPCQHIYSAACETVCLYCDVRCYCDVHCLRPFLGHWFSFNSATVNWRIKWCYLWRDCVLACPLIFVLRCAFFGQTSSNWFDCFEINSLTCCIWYNK